jgi:GT2 family glycosyltransferase
MNKPIHIIICTHTPRHLKAVLASIANQTVFPDSVSVTCDVDNPEIEAIIQDMANKYNKRFFYTARESHGIMRASQVRNNAVRTLEKSGIHDGLLLFFDGDIFLLPTVVELYQALSDKPNLFHGNRIMLTENETVYLKKLKETNRYFPLSKNDKRFEQLEKIDKKLHKHNFLRKLKLIKAGKPTILGAHFGFSFDLYKSINGFDEEYEGYGCEDDDLARRALKKGAVSCIVTSKILVYHLAHESQAEVKWKENPGVKRFLGMPWKPYCNHGLDNPLPQNPLKQIEIHSIPND